MARHSSSRGESGNRHETSPLGSVGPHRSTMKHVHRYVRNFMAQDFSKEALRTVAQLRLKANHALPRLTATEGSAQPRAELDSHLLDEVRDVPGALPVTYPGSLLFGTHS